METLSTLATFDDLRRCEFVLTDGAAEIEFLQFAKYQEQNRLQWLNAVNEAQRLQRELDTALLNMADLETKLYHARRIIEMEKKYRREAENERELNEQKLSHVRDLVRNERDINEETKDKFAFLNSCQKKRKSAKILQDKFGNEFNSTGSLLSDLSVTQSEEDYLESGITKKLRKPRTSNTEHASSFVAGKRFKISTDRNVRKSEGNRKSTANRKSAANNSNHIMEIGAGDKIVAHTKVSIPQGNGPIHAESTIEAIPQNIDKENISPTEINLQKRKSNNNIHYSPSTPPMVEKGNSTYGQNLQHVQNTPSRPHSFTTRTFLKSDSCLNCQKKIRFGSVALKCRDCRICIHTDCKSQLKYVCVPQSIGTPTLKGPMGVIADYAPSEAPMVPGIIVHCINEIETRGLNEVGIYRVSGSERDIKALKERFIRGKTLPPLVNIDVHVLCGCIKDFLRSLREPLIPTSLWKHFSNAAQSVNSEDSLRELYNAINKLPLANRDTLAFLIQHFLRVANCPEVKMPISNISKVFGPTIVGYSSPDPDQHAIFTETIIQANVMEKLLNIPADYWSRFLNVDMNKVVIPEKDYGAPSKQYFGTPSIRHTSRKGKFYATPPYTMNRKK